MSNWYKLDNAAKLFPSVTNSDNSSVYRVAAVLTEPVAGDVLQKAVKRTISRYPMLFIRMVRGVFWNYFDSNPEAFIIEEERNSPCSVITPNQNRGYFLKVIYSGHRISVEIFHSLTDGSGAVEFLKSLLYYYFSMLGHDIDSEGKILLSDGYVPPDNMEDSFAAYYEEIASEPQKEPTSYHITGTLFDQRGNNVTTGVMNAGELNRTAKAKGATITAYLTAALIFSIYMTRQNYDRRMGPIVVSVPANLRKALPSATLRNFFGVVNVGMTVKRETTFDEIIDETVRQLKEKTTTEALQRSVSRNVVLEKKLYTKLVPLWIKKRVVNIGFHLRGERVKTITLSNLGNFPLPAGMSGLLSHMEVVLYPTKKSPINVGVCSANDRLTISFSRSIQEADLLRYFFRFLSEQSGIEIAVYSNDWGVQNETLQEL